VSSEDGLDEMSSSAPTHVVEVSGGDIRRYTVSVADVGLDLADPDEVGGGPPPVNAATTRRILAGERGAPRDLAALNAGAAIYAGGGAETLEAGVRAAERAIDDGSAARVLERLAAYTHALEVGRSPTGYARPEAERRDHNAGLDAPRR
jgi:anthranilate phosphoribosyltransferase